MGNLQHKMSEPCFRMENVVDFQFHDEFLLEDFNNGFVLKSYFIPEEILINILTFIEPERLLNLSLVCKSWCNIIKSSNIWRNIYEKKHPNKSAPKLPWYAFYSYFTTDNFVNLIRNGNGEERFKHWKIVKNFGDEFRIEEIPEGSDNLPENVPEFHGHKSCFSTSFYECNKAQVIDLRNKRLLRYIIKELKPAIYASEWVAGRFDCGCVYKLFISGYDKKFDEEMLHEETDDYEGEFPIIQPIFKEKQKLTFGAGEGTKWTKVEIKVSNYKDGLITIIFQHEGLDTQFWKGHYGSKMAGGVVRFDFESMDISKI